jgi:hypothetical protein
MAGYPTRVCGVESTKEVGQLMIMLRFIGALIVLSGAAVSVATLAISGRLDSGLVGLVLTYALK